MPAAGQVAQYALPSGNPFQGVGAPKKLVEHDQYSRRFVRQP